MDQIREVQQSFISPTLGREYCLYFLYLTILSFIILILAVVDSGYGVIKGDVPILSALISLIVPFLLYINNRILYSMCDKTLQ